MSKNATLSHCHSWVTWVHFIVFNERAQQFFIFVYIRVCLYNKRKKIEYAVFKNRKNPGKKLRIGNVKINVIN